MEGEKEGRLEKARGRGRLGWWREDIPPPCLPTAKFCHHAWRGCHHCLGRGATHCCFGSDETNTASGRTIDAFLGGRSRGSACCTALGGSLLCKFSTWGGQGLLLPGWWVVGTDMPCLPAACFLPATLERMDEPFPRILLLLHLPLLLHRQEQVPMGLPCPLPLPPPLFPMHGMRPSPTFPLFFCMGWWYGNFPFYLPWRR